MKLNGEKMGKFVIYDMDGLLIDSEGVYWEAYKYVGDKMGAEISDDFYKSLVGNNASIICGKLEERFGSGFDSKKMMEMVRDYSQEKATVQGGIPLKYYAGESIEIFKERGFKIALSTSNFESSAKKLLESHGLFDTFDAKTFGGDVKIGKPNPEIFLKTAEKLGVKPEECYVLEDSENGVRAGYAAKMMTICVPDMIYPCEEVIEKATIIVKDLKEATEYILQKEKQENNR